MLLQDTHNTSDTSPKPIPHIVTGVEAAVDEDFAEAPRVPDTPVCSLSTAASTPPALLGPSKSIQRACCTPFQTRLLAPHAAAPQESATAAGTKRLTLETSYFEMINSPACLVHQGSLPGRPTLGRLTVKELSVVSCATVKVLYKLCLVCMIPNSPANSVRILEKRLRFKSKDHQHERGSL